MQKKEKKPDMFQFLACFECGGLGLRALNRPCPKCGGLGMGAVSGGRFYYWGRPVTNFTIGMNRAKRIFDASLNLFALALGAGGVIALLWYIIQSTGSMTPYDLPELWKAKNALLLYFWISLVPDMFVVYRIIEEGSSRRKITALPANTPATAAEAFLSWEQVKMLKAKDRIDVAKSYTERAMKAVEEAHLFAEETGFKKVSLKHLMIKLLEDSQPAALFTRLSIYVPDLSAKLKKLLSFEALTPDALANELDVKGAGQGRPGTAMSEQFGAVLIAAYMHAREIGSPYVETMNFILPIIERDPQVEELLYDLEAEKQKVANVERWFRLNDEIIEQYREFRHLARFKPGSNMDRAYTAIATPALDHFGFDLTAAAKYAKLEFCVAREAEIEQVWSNLESGHAGVILVGPDGVGKNTIIHGIAQRMVKEDVPAMLKDKRLIEIDVARLVAGGNASEAEYRMVALLDEATRSGNIILAINDIENIVGVSSGGEQSLDLSEVLSEALSRRSIICFATATPQNFTRYIETQALGRVMGKVAVDEPEGDRAIRIVSSKIGFFEGKYRAYYSYRAIEDAISITRRYMHDRYLPQKAIEALELAGVKASKQDAKKVAFIEREGIAAVVQELTGIPVSAAAGEESAKLLTLEKRIHERMIGQEEAVDMVSASLRRARAEMREGKRPIASFLFLGPTGVGKTELAKTVSAEYFGDEHAMSRIDMSEYQHPDSVVKMIGDPSGTPGYLTEAVRKKPFSLLLLDEFEKAYPQILNLFLQVMDDGRLTDGQGRTIDFTNTIIVATSNVGAVFIQEEIKKGTPIEKIKEELINSHLNQHLRPELINRFDGVIVFRPLGEDDVFAITKLMLGGIGRLLETKGVSLKYEDEGVRILARDGFDPKFGARPLRRLLQDRVENIIANKILAGELMRRDTVVIGKEAEIRVEKAKKL